jgi:uncharacterized membrane protein YidH (DUF202 family)
MREEIRSKAADVYRFCLNRLPTNRSNRISERRTTMKAATVAGLVLIVIGIIGFAMGGFSFTHEKKDVDLGPIQIEHQQKKTVPIPPILSAIALVGGIGLVVVGVRSK